MILIITFIYKILKYFTFSNLWHIFTLVILITCPFLAFSSLFIIHFTTFHVLVSINLVHVTFLFPVSFTLLHPFSGSSYVVKVTTINDLNQKSKIGEVGISFT
jgi:hypothetical protein